MAREKIRKLRTYKTFDAIYNPAKKKAKKYDTNLCRVIETLLKKMSQSKSEIITINLTDLTDN